MALSLTLPFVQELLARGKVISKEGSAHRVVKYGMEVWKTEMFAMEIVSNSTNVPVPRPLAYLSVPHGNAQKCGFIVMEKVPGVTLDTVLDTLDESTVKSLAAQITTYLEELHRLDSACWGMPGKGNVYHRTHFYYEPGSTPLTSTKDFIDYFANQADIDYGISDEDLAKFDLTRAPIHSHGDLKPENIMYDPDSCRITSIIDWEYAGCYPYFWNAHISSRRDARKDSWSIN